tara:strand:- start:2804 stop:2980 length:177 start_codon:yes stop_codon:yes gene_type:complete
MKPEFIQRTRAERTALGISINTPKNRRKPTWANRGTLAAMFILSFHAGILAVFFCLIK